MEAVRFCFNSIGGRPRRMLTPGSSSHHGLITRASEEAAKRLGLPRSWLNETVAMYTRPGEDVSDQTFVGVYPSPERVGLRVVAAKPKYLLAMKELARAIQSGSAS
jgi:hypothetical protein